ncbi:competence/damage-inducible protein A [Halobacteriales archaeon SW_7_71_33]|nr:MAG: competence/damage-inducible protein A [Halobacteriales archaeon SW_7_71_33]
MDVAVVTVGNELLAGDTVNTNAAWLCERLDRRTVDVRRVTVVPDDVSEIARVVNEYRADYDAVLVTGGLGPTHDDVTTEAVAAALGRPLVDSERARDWLTEHGYAAADLAPGTTHLPEGARPLHNEVGVAPGCVADSVYVLPGVPAEMEAMFESVADEFADGERLRESVLVDEYESALVDRLETLRERFDVWVGSYPGEYVRLRVRAEDGDELARATAWLRERVDAVEEPEEPEEPEA